MKYRWGYGFAKGAIFVFLGSLTIFVLSLTGYAEPQTKGGYSLEDTLLDLRKSAQDVVQKNKSLSRKIERMKKRIPELREELKQQKAQGRTLSKENERLRADFVNEENSTELMKDRVRKLERELVQIKSAFDRGDEIINDRKSIKKRMKLQSEELRAQIDQLQLELKMGAMARPDPLNKKIDDLKTKISQVRSSLNRKEDALSSAQRRVATVQDNYGGVDKARSDLREKISGLQSDLLRLGEEEADLNAAFEAEKKNEEERVAQLNQEIVQVEDQARGLRQTIEEGQDASGKTDRQFATQRGKYVRTLERMKDEKQLLEDELALLGESLMLTKTLKEEISKTKGVDKKRSTVRQMVDYSANTQVSAQEDVEQKEGKLENLKDISEGIRKDIRDLRRELEEEGRKSQGALSAEQRRLQRLIANRERSVESAKDRFVAAQQALQGSQDQLDSIQKTKKDLKQQVASIQQDLQEALAAWNAKRSSLTNFQDSEKDRVSMLDIEIIELENQIDELNTIIKNSQDAERQLAEQFRREKGEFLKSLSKRKMENELLQQEEELLRGLRDGIWVLSRKKDVRQKPSEISAPRKELSKIEAQSERYLEQIESRQERVKALKQKQRDLKGEIDKITRDIRNVGRGIRYRDSEARKKYHKMISEQKQNIRGAQRALSDVKKDITRQKREISRVKSQKIVLERNREAIKKDLKRAIKRGRDLNDARPPSSDEMIDSINREIIDLELFRDELVALLASANEKLRVSREEYGSIKGGDQQLWEHRDILRNENSDLRRRLRQANQGI